VWFVKLPRQAILAAKTTTTITTTITATTTSSELRNKKHTWAWGLSNSQDKIKHKTTATVLWRRKTPNRTKQQQNNNNGVVRGTTNTLNEVSKTKATTSW
jgi:hypothetical protein